MENLIDTLLTHSSKPVRKFNVTVFPIDSKLEEGTEICIYIYKLYYNYMYSRLT